MLVPIHTAWIDAPAGGEHGGPSLDFLK